MMTKYAFKVYFSDSMSTQVVPKEIEGTELSDMDLFVFKCGSSFEFVERLKKELDFPTKNIDKITIIHTRTQVEFSLCVNNPYLISVLHDIKKRKMRGYGNYEMEVNTVSSHNETFLAMKEYLMNHLRDDYKLFLKDIYHYQNHFEILMNQYGSLYQLYSDSEEEVRRMRELELEIGEKLSIYKNYRGLSIARLNGEKSYKRYAQIPKEKVVSNLKIGILVNQPISLEKTTQEEANQINYYCNYVGEEKEEFLEPEELDTYIYEKHR